MDVQVTKMEKEMSADLAVYLSKQMLWQGILVSFPVIATTLICGLVVSLTQAVTQIQDSSLSFIPKIIAAILMLMLTAGWMLHQLTQYAAEVITHIPKVLS